MFFKKAQSSKVENIKKAQSLKDTMSKLLREIKTPPTISKRRS